MNPPLVPWAGFWIGSFEGADPVDATGRPHDAAYASGHLGRLEEDHRRAAQAGFRTVREVAGWRVSENRGGLDLGRVQRIAASARRHGLQVLWTLMQHGLPQDLSLHDDALVPRLARFAGAVAELLRHQAPAPRLYTPVALIGLTAHAAAQSGWFAPPNGLPPGQEGDSLVCGYAVKRRLVRAALAAMAAIRAVDPQARFVHVESLLHVVAAPGAARHAAEAAIVRDWQWQVWDLLAGRREPELGGHPEALDLIGAEHGPASQWELPGERRLAWQHDDPRRRPLCEMLDEAWQRYGRPLLAISAGHEGARRAAWLHHFAAQVQRARAHGVPVHGLSPGPLLDHPAWPADTGWRRCGLWHVGLPGGVRVAVQPLRAAMDRWQQVLPQRGAAPAPGPPLLVLTERRWDGTPPAEQAVLQALARERRIVVVEPACTGPGAAHLERRALDPQLELLVPHLPRPCARRGRALPALLALLQPWLAGEAMQQAQLWPLARSQRRLARALAGRPPCPLPPPPASVDLRLHRLLATRRVAGWSDEQVRALIGTLPAPRLLCVDDAGGAQVDEALLFELADTLPQVQLMLAGEALVQRARLQARRPNVHLLRQVGATLLPALLAASDVVLRPLREAGDGTALLQALASGRPVIASGPPELADSECLGVRRVADAIGLVEAVRAALQETPAAARRRRRRSMTLLHARDARQVAQRLQRALQACA